MCTHNTKGLVASKPNQKFDPLALAYHLTQPLSQNHIFQIFIPQPSSSADGLQENGGPTIKSMFQSSLYKVSKRKSLKDIRNAIYTYIYKKNYSMIIL